MDSYVLRIYYVVIISLLHGVTYADEAEQVNLKYRYVINLSSSLDPINSQTIPRLAVFESHRLYQAHFKTSSKTWYRLRLGFFKTNKSAEKIKNELLEYYPRAWVTVTSEKERRESEKGSIVAQGGVPRIKLSQGVDPLPNEAELKQDVTSIRKQEPSQKIKSQEKDLVELTRNALTAGEYTKAIQYATALLEQEGEGSNPEAIELLGLARERNGQLAHAKAEYEKYLQLYSDGEDAERVQQRLAGLITASKPATPVPKKMAKTEEKTETKPPWRTLGSLSQYYYRDERSVDEEEDIVDLSRLITTLSLTSRKVTTKYEHRVEFNGDHSYDFLEKEHEGRFTSFYYEMVHRSSRRHLRVGRQSHSSGGVLGRFDGINAGVEITNDLKLDATAGYLLDPEGLFNYESNRKFISANFDLGHIFDRVDFNIYLIRQYADDVLDRYAVGTETRYFDPKYSMFNLIDYDLFYDELNVFLLNNNWVFSDSSTFFVNFDFRKSPYLTTYNSIISQPVRTIHELQETYTLDEIYQLALDRTAEVKTFSIGGSHPLVGLFNGHGDYQFSADLTVTNTGPMPASGGVEAFEGTGNELFLGTQLIGNNIFTDGDVSILSLRIGVAQNHNDYTFSLNNRTPIANRVWRFNPVIQYNRRENTNNEDTRDTTRFSLKIEYRPVRSILLETQVGIDRTREKVAGTAVASDIVFFNAGYRWDFR